MESQPSGKVISLSALRAEFLEGLASLRYPESAGSGLFAPVKFAMECGGKRLRPLLLLSTYQWLAQDHDALAQWKEALQAALAVEIFHNFTLLHDDLMDQSELRRGRPTVWQKWDANTAILSGDAMCIFAYQQLYGLPASVLPGVFMRFNTLAMGVCEGQALDMKFERQEGVTAGEYITMVEGKTVALFQGCVAIGLHMSRGESDNLERLLVESAGHMGVAFQLQDDLLDLYGTTEKLGKECGDDLMSRKTTYLSIMAHKHSTVVQREEMESVLTSTSLTRAEKVATMQELYRSVGAPQGVEQEIARRLSLADDSLGQAEALVGRKASVIREIYAGLVNRQS